MLEIISRHTVHQAKNLCLKPTSILMMPELKEEIKDFLDNQMKSNRIAMQNQDRIVNF